MIILGPDTIIDTVQNMKRMVVNQFVQDRVILEAAHNYIDSQTHFAKMLVKNTLDIVQHQYKQCTEYFPSGKSTDTNTQEK
jgi:hypothetical protein